jgi:hypothetical protein
MPGQRLRFPATGECACKGAVVSPTADGDIWRRTLCEVIDGQLPVGVLGEELESDLGLAFSYHQMDDDQTLEDDGPCRVAQAVGEGAEDLSDACFASVCSDEYMLDIFGLWCCELRAMLAAGNGNGNDNGAGAGRLDSAEARTCLDLGAALDALLKGAGHRLLRILPAPADGCPTGLLTRWAGGRPGAWLAARVAPSQWLCWLCWL